MALAAALIIASGCSVVGSAHAQSGGAKAAGGGEVEQLRKRVQQLEEQLVDVQVVLGTLESLARSGAGSSSGAAPVSASGGARSGANAARIAALETQIRALTAQVQQLSQTQIQQPAAQTQGWQSSSPGNLQGQPAAPVQGFGSTTVQPEAGDRIGSMIANNGAAQAGTAATSFADGASAQQDYEAAYGLLLQQNYGAAQAAFADFIKKHRSHALAGNAQYWLGETYYVQGQYKSAAGAFLKGYRSFGSSAKAPDSLLKLAMSLDRLGQRTAACSSLSELSTKFPQAAGHVKRRASQERRRLRC